MSEIFIDVRELPEFTSGHIADAKSVPLGSLARASSTWDKTQPVTLVCKGGRKADQARLQLEARGFSSLSVLPGGMDAWCAAGNLSSRGTKSLVNGTVGEDGRRFTRCRDSRLESFSVPLLSAWDGACGRRTGVCRGERQLHDGFTAGPSTVESRG